MLIRVAFRTLGCKLNQLETESLADAFRRAGASVVGFDEAAEIYLVNTCTVTGKAEQKARRLVRTTLASRPGAVVIATGCYAAVDAAGLSALHERALVIPGGEKSLILSLAPYLAENWQGHGDLFDAILEWRRGSAAGADPFAFLPEEFSFHSRPSLKVQDGCDNRCSYCRVCIARGPSRSLSADLALERLRALEASGRAEAVLTGVNLSQYRDGGRDFPGLLRFLVEGTSRIALRLSSYEPDRVDEAFLEVFASPRVRPHIHLPVQSGSDAILGRMGRGYRSRSVRESCDALRRAKGDPFLAADIIAGFPGETDADFAESLSLARDCGFAWIHAFPFSARPGTKAEAMRPRVPERIAGERVSALSALAHEGRAAYLARYSGAELEAVLEAAVPIADSAATEASGSNTAPPLGASHTATHAMASDGGLSARYATSENYLKLLVKGLPTLGGTAPRGGMAVRCRIVPFAEALADTASDVAAVDDASLGSEDALAEFIAFPAEAGSMRYPPS